MKIVLVALLGFAPFILALQTESADDCAVEDEATILPLFMRALDPSYECHSLNDGNLSTGPQVYNIVGCNEPDASWNYNYQTDDLSKGRPKKLFNGLSTISFDSNLGNSKYRFGLKHNKCIKPFWNRFFPGYAIPTETAEPQLLGNYKITQPRSSYLKLFSKTIFKQT